MITGGLMDSGASSAFFAKPGTSLALIFPAIIMLSYIIITLNYIVTFVEKLSGYFGGLISWASAEAGGPFLTPSGSLDWRSRLA
jgi:hypothetical protein